MGTEEKKDFPVVIQTPPVYSRNDATNEKGMRKSTITLIVYTTAVTVLFLVAASLAGVIYNKQMNSCTTTQVVKSDPTQIKRERIEMEKDGKKIQEDTQIDYQKQIAVYTLVNGKDKDTTVVIDFKRRLTGMYDPDEKECYLIGGVDHDLKPSDTGSSVADVENDDVTNVNYTLERSDDSPISDTSILPEYLQEKCEGLRTYWLNMVPSKGESSRQKRQVRCRWRYRCYFWYYRGRWYYRCYLYCQRI